MAFPVTTIPPSSGGGGGSSDFGDITGWPGASTDFVRGDGSDGPLSASDIPNLDTAKITTGQFVDGRMPTASNAAAQAAQDSAIAGKVPLGSSIGNTADPGASTRSLHTKNNATDFVTNATAAGVNALSCGGVDRIRAVGNSATNEAGATDLRCGILARAASTSFNLLAITANTCGQIVINDNVMTAGAFTSIRVTNGALISIAGETSVYVTGSPSSTQAQLTISGGYLVLTTGSAWTRKVGCNGCQIGEVV